MMRLLLAGLGGMVGTMLRFLANELLEPWSNRWGFPCATLVVNLVGCLVIGLLSHWAELSGRLSPEGRALLLVGVLGGLTTYSSFGNETVNLWRVHHLMLALVNVVLHLVLGLGAVWCGRWLAQWWLNGSDAG